MSEPHSIPADNEKAWEESDNIVLKQNYAAIQEASVDDHGIPIPAVMEKIIDSFVPEETEDRYEHIELIVKSRPDGEDWFDVIHDYITKDCDSVPVRLEDDEEGFEQWTPCHCGMESMSGMSGTLQQCYDHSTSLGQGVQPIDVARALVALSDYKFDTYNINPTAKAVAWARKEIEFEKYFENREWEKEEDESPE